MPSFWVGGTPAPQGSKTYYGRGRAVESSKRLPAWRKSLIEAFGAFDGAPIDSPVIVNVVFHMHRPRKPKFLDVPAVVPDLDKLQRAVGDALTIAGVITDDARIVGWHATKIYADGEHTGAEIRVEEYESTKN